MYCRWSFDTKKVRTLTPATDSTAVTSHDVLAIACEDIGPTKTLSPRALVLVLASTLSRPSNVRLFIKIAAGIGLALIIVAAFGWPDVIVLSGMAALVAGATRRVFAISAVLLLTVSFPPFSWPTWWFCLTPLLWIWRDREIVLSESRIIVEAVAVGFAMGWLSTGFVRASLPSFGWLIHAAACLLFSLQVVAIVVAIRLTRNKSVLLSAPTCALAAVGGELFEAWCGVSWSVTNLALTVGATPVAQWSQWITPFGVSGVLYLVNFFWVPEESANIGRRWAGPAISIGIAVLAWCGGSRIAATVSVEPLPFSTILVQPHLKVSDELPWRPWIELDQMTRASLLQNGPVDLVVWPETCLSSSWIGEKQSQISDMASQLTVHGFARLLAPEYGTTCLVGAVVLERGRMYRYGLVVPETRRYNCGCLVSKSGDIARHEKLDLVPFKEGLPGLLDVHWIRNRVLPALQLNQPLSLGRNFAPLSFLDREGRKRSIAVSVCYESLLPWLPQYSDATTAEAIIHLVYDGNFAEHPGMMQRHIRACQYRAIETRKWNLVCSMWSGSVIIDPSGKIVRQLSATAGVLRSELPGN